MLLPRVIVGEWAGEGTDAEVEGLRISSRNASDARMASIGGGT